MLILLFLSFIYSISASVLNSQQENLVLNKNAEYKNHYASPVRDQFPKNTSHPSAAQTSTTTTTTTTNHPPHNLPHRLYNHPPRRPPYQLLHQAPLYTQRMAQNGLVYNQPTLQQHYDYAPTGKL